MILNPKVSRAVDKLFLRIIHFSVPFRRTKTRSFDNLPSACELGSSLAPNRRSSDPSLNEKWQDHRRSLELNVAVGPEEGGDQDQVVQTNGAGPYPDRGESELGNNPQPQGVALTLSAAGGEADEAELSVAVGVAEGQMENILQEATKEEAGADQKERSAAVTHDLKIVDIEVVKEAKDAEQCENVNGSETYSPAFANGHQPGNGVIQPEEDGDSPLLPTQKTKEPNQHSAELVQTQEDVMKQEELEQGPSDSLSDEPDQPAAHRTLNNGFLDKSPEEPQVDTETCPESGHGVCEPMEQVDKKGSLMESSTETLTEEVCGRLELHPQLPSCLSHQSCSDGRSQPPCFRKEKGQETGEHVFIRTLNGGNKRPSVSAFHSVSADLRDGLSNSDGSDGEPCSPHWAKRNGERAPLSRQVSLASCNSLILHPRCSCSQHCHVLLGRASNSPEQPSRSHLDDDGLTLHTDAIQQRLRQIEVGHQMEVETLKKQVQELRSRLENQQHTGSDRINGDMGEEVVGF